MPSIQTASVELALSTRQNKNRSQRSPSITLSTKRTPLETATRTASPASFCRELTWKRPDRSALWHCIETEISPKERQAWNGIWVNPQLTAFGESSSQELIVVFPGIDSVHILAVQNQRIVRVVRIAVGAKVARNSSHRLHPYRRRKS
jgi:hypothetical protein